MLATRPEKRKTHDMPQNYIYEGERGYECLDPFTTLRKAIIDSFKAGRLVVPIGVGDFCTMMRDANLTDERTLNEQLVDFAAQCGLRYTIENHSQTVCFRPNASGLTKLQASSNTHNTASECNRGVATWELSRRYTLCLPEPY
jgi:hypothetical protein